VLLLYTADFVETAAYKITGYSGINFDKKFKVFHTIFTKFWMATEVKVFVLVRVTMNTPLVRASPV